MVCVQDCYGMMSLCFFFFQAEDGIRDRDVTGVQTCALPISDVAAKVRDIGVVTAMYGQVFFVALTLLASVVTAIVYGLGGTLVIHGTLQIGTLVALTTLLARVYGPITSLSSVQVNVMTALVSFDRVFEVLDLKPLIVEKPGAVPLPRSVGASRPGAPAQDTFAQDTVAPEIEFDDVSFRYPSASEV